MEAWEMTKRTIFFFFLATGTEQYVASRPAQRQARHRRNLITYSSLPPLGPAAASFLRTSKLPNRSAAIAMHKAALKGMTPVV